MSEPTGQPSRYQRSMGGMIGAMLVTLVAVGVFVGIRALNRDELDVRPESVDYLLSVTYAGENGIDVVYPPSLPQGWQATSVDLEPSDPPAWGLGMLTDEGRFAGLRQESDSAEDLAEALMDEDAVEGDPVTLDSDLAREWTTWSDQGGDHGFSAEVGDQTVLVYGSAPEAELRRLAESLVVGTAGR